MKNKKILIPVLVAIIVVLVVVVAVLLFPKTKEEYNPIAGEYDCTSLEGASSEYLVSIYLYKDGTFLYGPYGDLDNNHAKGNYTYEHEEDKDGKVEGYTYYMVSFKGDAKDFISEGKSIGRDFESEMEFGLTEENGKRQGVVMFLSTYNMYYCYAK